MGEWLEALTRRRNFEAVADTDDQRRYLFRLYIRTQKSRPSLWPLDMII